MGKNIEDVIHSYKKTRDKTNNGFNQYIRSVCLFLDVAFIDMKRRFSQTKEITLLLLAVCWFITDVVIEHDENKIKQFNQYLT